MIEPLSTSAQVCQIIAHYAPALLQSLSASGTLWVVIDGLSAAAAPALDAVLAALAAEHAPALHGLLCGAEVGATSHLQSSAAHIGADLPALLERIGAAALLLIDTHTTLPVLGGVDVLARRLARTDVLLRYDHAAAQHWLDQQGESGLPFAAASALDALYASRHWRDRVQSSSDSAVITEDLRELYVQMLVEHGGSRWRWAASTPIRTTWGALEYDWVFASSDRAAGHLMSALLYAAAGWYHDTPEAAQNRATAGQPVQIGLFDHAPPQAADLEHAKVAAIAAAIELIGTQQPRPWTYGDLYDHMLRRRAWFGQLSPAQFQAACAALAAADRLQRRPPDAAWQPSTLLRFT